MKKYLQILFEQGQLHRHLSYSERKILMCVEAEVSFIKIPGFPQATDSVIITYWWYMQVNLLTVDSMCFQLEREREREKMVL